MKGNTVLQIWKWTINAFGQIIICSILLLSAAGSSKSDDVTQTLVFIRHGEKPNEGLGQLNCKGLNRALALPPVIANSFGRPDVIYAPNPSDKKKTRGAL